MPRLRAVPTRWLVGIALAISTAAKIWWACHSAGSIDAVLFFNFGKAIGQGSLGQLYEHEQLFNHTPLIGLVMYGLCQVSRNDFVVFSILLRGLSIAADIGVVIALLRVAHRIGKPSRWLLMFFALSPVSIMISGFHGNVDPIMVLFLVVAVVAALDDNAVWSGLLFGLACNIKVAPIVLLPVFFLFWQARGRGTPFGISSALVLLAGSAWPLWHSPVAYVHHVFGYGSFWGEWGITYWLRMTGAAALQKVDFRGLSQAQVAIMSALKLLLAAGVVFIAWRRRCVSAQGLFVSLFAAWTVIFIFAPGVGVQYMVWAAPFALFISPVWPVTLAVCSSAFLFMFYYSTSRGELPFVFSLPLEQHLPAWCPWGNLPWLVFVGALIVNWRPWLLLGGNRLRQQNGPKTSLVSDRIHEETAVLA